MNFQIKVLKLLTSFNGSSTEKLHPMNDASSSTSSCKFIVVGHIYKCRPSKLQSFLLPWPVSLHTSQVAHQAGAYPGFHSMKRLGIFLLPPGWESTPSIKFAGTHLYTWVERGTVRVKCLAYEHNTMSPARSPTRTAR